VDLQFLAKQRQKAIDEMRQLRKEHADLMRLVVSGHELTRRVERRQNELRDDLEVLIRMEIGGAMANMQAAIEASLAWMDEQSRHRPPA
jgi:hypothetical protein